MRDGFILTKEQCSDAFDNLLIEIAMSSYAVREGCELVKENEQVKKLSEFTLPPNEEKAIRTEIRKHKNRQNLKLVQKAAKKLFTQAAVVFLILAIGLGTTMTVSAEFKRTIYKLMLTTSEIDTEIRVKRGYTEFVDSDAYIHEKYEGNLFAPTKMPVGYSIASISDNRVSYRVVYTNENGNEISFSQMVTGSEAARWIDTENAQRVEKIIIGDSEALLVTKVYGDVIATSITWSIGDYMLTLISLGNDADAETVIDIAQNIKLMK